MDPIRELLILWKVSNDMREAAGQLGTSPSYHDLAKAIGWIDYRIEQLAEAAGFPRANMVNRAMFQQWIGTLLAPPAS